MMYMSIYRMEKRKEKSLGSITEGIWRKENIYKRDMNNLLILMNKI